MSDCLHASAAAPPLSWKVAGWILFLSTAVALSILIARNAAEPPVPSWVVFPGRQWQTITPQEAGLDTEAFHAWVASQKPAFGSAYGGQEPNAGGVVITRAGYILHTWGDPNFKYQSASLGKTFTRMVLQLAIDEGLIHSVDDLVKNYWTGEGRLGSHKAMNEGHHVSITFRHLRDMKAGFAVTNGWFWRTRDPAGIVGPRRVPSWATYTGDPDYDNCAHIAPGKVSLYSSGGYWRLSQALTAIWRKDLKEVLDEHIMGPIGIPARGWDWLCGEDVRKNRDFYPGMPGYGDFIDPPYEIDGIRVRGGPGWVIMSASDLARLGLLVATQGTWNGKRLISRLEGNAAVGGNRVDGWGVIGPRKVRGYFSFARVATDFADPTLPLMASWIVQDGTGETK